MLWIGERINSKQNQKIMSVEWRNKTIKDIFQMIADRLRFYLRLCFQKLWTDAVPWWSSVELRILTNLPKTILLTDSSVDTMWNQVTWLKSTLSITSLYTTWIPRPKILGVFISPMFTKHNENWILKKSTAVDWIPILHCFMWEKKSSPYWLMLIEFKCVKLFIYCTKWIVFICVPHKSKWGHFC